nr:polyprenyl synthetase family protein [Plesiocystis pacifica]
MRHAVFPGGGRLRPGLTLSVAMACKADARVSLDAQADVAAAMELMHCASLVHDDLPCFDDAPLRRGRPSVHAAFGEELAVLAGDGLIILAYEVIAETNLPPSAVPKLIRCISRGVGAGGGLVAGQAWESERSVGLQTYHQAKTGALFEAGARAGAILAGAPQEPWAKFGAHLGEAYQVADDLRDALGDARELGKPVGQDIAHNRPNACISLGVDGAVNRLRALLDRAIDTIPACPEPDRVVDWVDSFAGRLYAGASKSKAPRPMASQSQAANEPVAINLRA